MTVSERIIQDYLEKGLTMADVPKELKYRLNDKGEMKIYRYMVAHGLIKENPPEPEEKPEPKKTEPKKPEPPQRPVEQPKGDNNTMTNIYMDKMKAAISDYYKQAVEIEKQIKTNKERLQPTISYEANEKLNEQRRALYYKAKDAIDAAFQGVLASIDRWAVFDGTKITDDMKLLSGAFPLAEADVVGLIAKYKDNYTMLAALDKYAAENGFAQNRAQIRTPENRKAAWSKVHAGAITLLDTASNDVQNPILDFAVERFGTMGYLASEIYNLL